MGTYLSTPVTEKGEESGETPQLAWCVVDMQGWRKNMEDAHVAQTDVVVPSHLFASDEEKTGEGKVFGVFDGHGGPEVARFCQLYIVSVLTQQPTWREDVVVTESNMVYSWRDPATTPVGQALIQAFHAMDRLINDPLRREEIIRLRAEKPMPGEYRVACYVPPPHSVENYEESSDGYESSDQMNNEPDVKVQNEPTDTPIPSVTEDTSPQKVAPSVEKENASETTTTEASTQPTVDALVTSEISDGVPLDVDTTNETEEPKTEPPPAMEESELTDPELITAEVSPPIAQADLESGLSADVQPTPDSTEESVTDAPQVLETQANAKDTDVVAEGGQQKDINEGDENDDGGKEDDDGGKEDDDSNEAVGKEEAAELDQDMMDGDSSPPNASETTSLSSREESSNRRSPPGKVSVMFQKLLSISGQVVVNVVRDKGTESDTAETDSSSQTNDSPVPFHSNQNAFGVSRPSAATPTIIHNGRQICNLPDHPIHAGCTAVVAVLIGRTLTIANAGDSRAVLCRAGGKAEPLSFDHKPLQEREMQRITRAGGFVNQFGRVNGNLNLSRSIGDLKYKQVPGINPAGQMITAEPDIVQVKLYPMDEFFILGCDGIWDCLTNDQAVAYVRERIDTKTPIEIGVEMLDTIISEDPRASQGIGGDNMTVMIVDLLPHTRSYRAKAS